MITEKIYSMVKRAVESEINLPEDWLNSSKSEDATDARHILCYYMHNYGMSSAQIQSATGLKKSTVNKFLSNINVRITRRRITYVWWLQIGNKLNANDGNEAGLCEYFCNGLHGKSINKPNH